MLRRGDSNNIPPTMQVNNNYIESNVKLSLPIYEYSTAT